MMASTVLYGQKKYQYKNYSSQFAMVAMVPILETTKYGHLIKEFQNVHDIVSTYGLQYDILLDVAIDNTDRVQQHRSGELKICSVNGHYFMLKYMRRDR